MTVRPDIAITFGEPPLDVNSPEFIAASVRITERLLSGQSPFDESPTYYFWLGKDAEPFFARYRWRTN